MSGDLPPGVTQADIDRASPGYYDEPIACDLCLSIDCRICDCEAGPQCLCPWPETDDDYPCGRAQ